MPKSKQRRARAESHLKLRNDRWRCHEATPHLSAKRIHLTKRTIIGSTIGIVQNTGIGRSLQLGIFLLLVAAYLTSQAQNSFEWRDASGNTRNLFDLEEILLKNQNWVHSDRKSGTQADLSGAYLDRAPLINAPLSEAQLSYAHLSDPERREPARRERERRVTAAHGPERREPDRREPRSSSLRTSVPSGIAGNGSSREFGPAHL